MPNHYEDHWVCEYWNADEARWVLVDAQLDALQREHAGDRRSTRWTCRATSSSSAGKAWQLCRTGQADPEPFGIFDMHGLWFVRGDLVRDVAALNKVELLPWDGWGLIDARDEDLSAADWALLDRVAALTAVDDPPFAEVRAIYEGADRLRMPPEYVQDAQRFNLLPTSRGT